MLEKGGCSTTSVLRQLLGKPGCLGCNGARECLGAPTVAKGARVLGCLGAREPVVRCSGGIARAGRVSRAPQFSGAWCVDVAEGAQPLQCSGNRQGHCFGSSVLGHFGARTRACPLRCSDNCSGRPSVSGASVIGNALVRGPLLRVLGHLGALDTYWVVVLRSQSLGAREAVLERQCSSKAGVSSTSVLGSMARRPDQGYSTTTVLGKPKGSWKKKENFV